MLATSSSVLQASEIMQKPQHLHWVVASIMSQEDGQQDPDNDLFAMRYSVRQRRQVSAVCQSALPWQQRGSACACAEFMQACVASLLVSKAPDVACPYACCGLVAYKPGSPCPSLATAPWQVEFFDPVQYDGEFTGSQQPVDSTGPGGIRKRRDREQSRDERARRRHERQGLEAGEESDGEEEVRLTEELCAPASWPGRQ